MGAAAIALPHAGSFNSTDAHEASYLRSQCISLVGAGEGFEKHCGTPSKGDAADVYYYYLRRVVLDSSAHCLHTLCL